MGSPVLKNWTFQNTDDGQVIVQHVNGNGVVASKGGGASIEGYILCDLVEDIMQEAGGDPWERFAGLTIAMCEVRTGVDQAACKIHIPGSSAQRAITIHPSEGDMDTQDLDPMALDKLFANVERTEEDRFPAYRVSDKHGHDTGMISYLGNNEWRIYVDNFPSQKKYFTSNLPIKTVGQFVADIERTGLNLVAVKQEG